MSKVGNYEPPYPPSAPPNPYAAQPSYGFVVPPPQAQVQQMPQPQQHYQQNTYMAQAQTMPLNMGLMPMSLVPQPQLPIVWMRTPPSLPNYPPGLEYLLTLDKILVAQELVATILANFGGKNRYRILNSAGEQIYTAAENPNVNMSNYQDRAFIIQLTDQYNREVMRIIRETAPCGCPCCISCCKDCAVELKVECPPGNPLGLIRQQGKCCRISLGVMDSKEKIHLNITTPAVFQTRGNVEFPISSHDSDAQIGSIMKYYAGELQEMLTKADNFGVHVPPQLDITMKAILLGGVFLIDFLFFESSPYHHHHHHH